LPLALEDPGSHGWDDYLLLHHYDPKEHRDQL